MQLTANLKQIATNTSWIVLDRIIRMGIGFVVGVWVARYLGPSKYGVLSFCIAWVSMFSVLSTLGLEGVIVREMVSDKHDTPTVLGTAVTMRLFGGLLCVIAAGGFYLLIYGLDNRDQLLIIFILASAQVFLASEVIDYWFRSRVAWKYVFWARISAFAISASLKIVLLLTNKASVVLLASIVLVDAILVAGFLLFALSTQPERPEKWRVRLETATSLIRDSWPNFLAGIAVLVYMRIDQIMIGSILTEADIGIYSVAVKISSVWYVIPLAITQSVTPGIVKSKKANPDLYREKLTRIVSLLFWLSVLVAIPVTFVSPWLINRIYGAEYRAAGDVLRVHFWAGIFVAIGMATSQWFLAENRLKLSLYRTSLGLLVNVILNIWLIPRMGIIGAAVATVISQSVASFWSIFFFRDTSELSKITIKGIASLPFRRRI